MTNPPPESRRDDAPIIRPLHYQALAAIGLAMIAFAQHMQRLEIANLVVAAVGVGMIVFPSPRFPMVFFVMVAAVQAYVHSETHPGFQFEDAFLMFDIVELLLAGGMLAFLASQYRLVGLQHSVVQLPSTTGRFGFRSKKDGPTIPTTRPESALTQEEFIRLIVAAPWWVLVAQVLWGWLYQNWTLAGLMPRFTQLAFVIWFVFLAMFFVRGVAGYWRATHADADEARMRLQDELWNDARGDYGRIGKWIVWGRQRAFKKWGKQS